MLSFEKLSCTIFSSEWEENFFHTPVKSEGEAGGFHASSLPDQVTYAVASLNSQAHVASSIPAIGISRVLRIARQLTLEDMHSSCAMLPVPMDVCPLVWDEVLHC